VKELDPQPPAEPGPEDVAPQAFEPRRTCIGHPGHHVREVGVLQEVPEPTLAWEPLSHRVEEDCVPIRAVQPGEGTDKLVDVPSLAPTFLPKPMTFDPDVHRLKRLLLEGFP